MRSKPAKLGFKVLAAEGELRVSVEKDFEAKHRAKEYKSWQLSKARKLRWWNKNKEAQNRAKRAVARTIAGQYKAARKKALRRGNGWKFSQKSWERAWQEAGFVLIPRSQTAQKPEGLVVPAFALRGSHRYNSTCMKRDDLSKAWSVDNCSIVFRGEILGPDNTWYRDELGS